MTETMINVSFKLPLGDYRRIPKRNRSVFFRTAVKSALENTDKPFVPKTEFAKQLTALRTKNIAKGAKLMTAEEIAEEVRARRGGLA